MLNEVHPETEGMFIQFSPSKTSYFARIYVDDANAIMSRTTPRSNEQDYVRLSTVSLAPLFTHYTMNAVLM
jgi:hypothetical protein